MSYQTIHNPPRKLEVVINPDETLNICISRAGADDKNCVKFAGYIEREDSKVIKRANKPTIKAIWNAGPWFVTEYDEYDVDDGMIYVELVAVLPSHA